jgi:ferredoxin
MKRKIIHIDREKCNGCGLCAAACHEGAIGMVDGKAKLLRDDYCDGLGDCLPHCPTGAITFEEREAAPYDRSAVEARMKDAGKKAAAGCPGSQPRKLHPAGGCPGSRMQELAPSHMGPVSPDGQQKASELRQWPVQIKLVPVKAPFFQGARLLIAADCTAYAYARFHQDFIRDHITIVGCPKLDAVDYREKLTAILTENEIRSVTVVRMEVPCCGGLENAAKEALKACGKLIPWQVVTISIDGRIIDRT